MFTILYIPTILIPKLLPGSLLSSTIRGGPHVWLLVAGDPSAARDFCRGDTGSAPDWNDGSGVMTDGGERGGEGMPSEPCGVARGDMLALKYDIQECFDS